MKFHLLICGALVIAAAQQTLAQDTASATAPPAPEKPFVAPPEPPPPLFILHVEGKTVEVDPDYNKTSMENVLQLNSEAINSIQFISGDEGLMRYGHKGRNGVVIVNFKEYSILPAGITVEDGE